MEIKMKDTVIAFLKSIKKTKVTLNDLERLVPGTVDYMTFANTILTLEKQHILSGIKSHGTNGKNPSLFHTYSISKSALRQNITDQIKNARRELHPSINLEEYFHLPEEQFHQDLPYLRKIHSYIKKSNFPSDEVPAPERSYEITGDEKWITEGGGQLVLQRAKVWDKLSILPVSDPLMLAVNPDSIRNSTHFHLIVENKTTYQGLLPALPYTPFTTLIYGSGKKIVKGIENFEYQMPLPDSTHHFYYFGDLDNEGIKIWHSLSKKVEVLPALPFYLACLSKPYVHGKQNQRPNDDSLTAFLQFFRNEEGESIRSMLQDGGYYPQESLKTGELKTIWRSASWK